MTELLDDLEPKKRKTTFSTLAYVLTLIAVVGWVYTIKILRGVISAYYSFPEHSLLIIRVTQFLSLAGVICLIISFAKSEPKNWRRHVAIIVIVLKVIFVIGAFAVFFYHRLNSPF